MPKYGYSVTPSYIPEDSLGNPTSSTTPLRFPGIVTDAKTASKFNVKQFRGFQISGAPNARAYSLVTPTKNEYDYSLSYIPVKRITNPKYAFQHFLSFALNNTGSTAAGGAWTYGTSCTTSLNSFTLYKQTSNINQQLNGCLVGKAMIKSSVDNPVEITVDGNATSSTYASLNRTAASSLLNQTPFMWSDCQVFIDGSLATNVTAFELTVNNNTEVQHTLGNRDPRLVYPKGQAVELKLTRFFNDTTDYSLAKGGSNRSFTIQIADSALGGTASLILRNCEHDDFPNPSDLEKLLVADLTVKANTVSIA